MAYLFLSHSKRDRKVAGEVLEALRVAGHEVWFDEERIQLGTRWEVVIADAVQNCGAIVFLASVNGYLTANVEEELYLAKRFQKQVYVIDLDRTKPPPHLNWIGRFDHVPYDLNGTHIVEITQAHPPDQSAPGTGAPHSSHAADSSPAGVYRLIGEKMGLGAWTVAARLTASSLESIYRRSAATAAAAEAFSKVVFAGPELPNLDNRLSAWERVRRDDYRATRAEALLLRQWHRDLLLALGQANAEALGQQDPRKAKIYLSYTASSDQPQIPGDPSTRWVTNLAEVLRVSVAEHLGLPGPRDSGVWMEAPEFAAGSEPSPDAQTALQNAALFVAVLSRSYLSCPRCSAERELFFRQAGDATGGRIFVVQTESLDEDDWREELGRNLQTYPFFETGPDGAGRLLGTPRPDEQDPAFFERARSLREALAGELGKSVGGGDKAGKKVFVAEAGPDLYGEWDKLRNHLKGIGYQIVPQEEYSRDPERFQAEAKVDLEPALVFLQLLGSFPVGNRGRGLPPGGYDELQFQSALDLGKEIIRWRPKGLRPGEIRDAAHRNFVSAADVLEMDFEEFQRHLEARLRMLVRRSRTAQTERLAEDSFFGVVGHEFDPGQTQAVTATMQDAGAAWELIPQTDDLTEIAPQEGYQGLVLLSHHSPEAWLREKLREFRKLWLKRLAKPPATGLLMEEGLPPIHFSQLTLIRGLPVGLQDFLRQAVTGTEPIREGTAHA